MLRGSKTSLAPALRNGTMAPAEACFDASAWYTGFSQEAPWNKYSQGFQDSVLASLFTSLEPKNKQYVEFGFDSHSYEGGGGSNTAYLHLTKNWTGNLVDGSNENPKINLTKAFVYPDTICSLLLSLGVPVGVDYISIDIDTCDLWVFLALTSESCGLRPRVVTVEYNSNYAMGVQKSIKRDACLSTTAPGDRYVWHGDNSQGASLSAHLMAGSRTGYSAVYVERRLDVFFVRDDLLCNGSGVPGEEFRGKTGVPIHTPNQAVADQFVREVGAKDVGAFLASLNSTMTQ